MVVAGPPARRGEAVAETIRWRELAGLSLILPSLPHSNRRLIEQAAIQHGARLNVAFEVDRYDDSQASSVVLRGRARELEGAEADEAEKLPLHSWIPTDKFSLVRIEPTEITGRHFILARPPPRPRRLSAEVRRPCASPV